MCVVGSPCRRRCGGAGRPGWRVARVQHQHLTDDDGGWATIRAASASRTTAGSTTPSSGAAPAPGACRPTPTASPSIGRATGGGSRSGDGPRRRVALPLAVVPDAARPGAGRAAPSAGAGRDHWLVGCGDGPAPGVRDGAALVPVRRCGSRGGGSPCVRSDRLNGTPRRASRRSARVSSGGSVGMGTLCDQFFEPYLGACHRSSNRVGSHERREDAPQQAYYLHGSSDAGYSKPRA